MTLLSEITEKCSPTPRNFAKAKDFGGIAIDPNLIFGIEIEIENADEDWCVPGMLVDPNEGSLRNNGLEFITTPMTYNNVLYCLDKFHNKANPTEENFTTTCSTHVHTNVLDLTIDQLISILGIYHVVEKQLFNVVGSNRYYNNYCVPYRESLIINNSYADIKIGHFSWPKYTALNLAPINTQGSIEWRHFPGYLDPELFTIWLRLISRIYSYIRKNTFETVNRKLTTLNSYSRYDSLILEIFQDEYKYMTPPNFRKMMEEGVLAYKYFLIR